MKNKMIYILVVVVTLLTVSYVLKTEVKVKELQSEPINDVDYIVHQQDEVDLLGFTTKPMIQTYDHETLRFLASHEKFDNEYYHYDFSLGQLYLENDYVPKTNQYIDYRSSKLYRNNELIIENIRTDNNQGFYKISDDQSKIIYFKAGELRTYTLATDVVKTITFDFNIDTVKEFNEAVGFSPQAGYFYYIEPATDLLNVFGADSGNLYGTKVFGKDPQWLNDEELLFINEQNKIGKYRVYQDEMTYFYTTDQKILGEYFTYGNKVLFFEVNDQQVQTINIYNFDTDYLKVLEKVLPLDQVTIDFQQQFAIIETKNQLLIYNLDKNVYFTIDHYSQLTDHQPYVVTQKGIIVKQGDQINLLNAEETIELSHRQGIIDEVLTNEQSCLIIYQQDGTYNISLKTYN